MANLCTNHGKMLDYYCLGHQQKVCSDCAIFDHKKCDVTNQMPNAPPGATSTGIQGLIPSTKMPTMKLNSVIVVRSASDKKNCKIVSAAFLSNGCIALVDKSNKKIKLLKEHEKNIVCETVVEESPFGVAEVSNNFIAVSIPKAKQVRFFQMDNLGYFGRFIKTEQPCNGIAYAKNKLFVVCQVSWSHSECIKVFDDSDNLIYKIKKDQRNENVISAVTEHLTVFPDTGNLAFKKGGFSKESLCVTTDEGMLVWKAKVDEWTEMYEGYAALGNGIVFILGKSLLFIGTETSSWGSVVAEETLKHPYNVAVSPDNSRLLVTQMTSSDHPEHDSIKVFNVIM